LLRTIIPSSFKEFFFLYQFLFSAGVGQFGIKGFEHIVGYDAAFSPQAFYGTDGEFPFGVGGPEFGRLFAHPASHFFYGFFYDRVCFLSIHWYSLPWNTSSIPRFPLSVCPEKEVPPPEW
jgi:hypothetical protein